MMVEWDVNYVFPKELFFLNALLKRSAKWYWKRIYVVKLVARKVWGKQ